MKRLSWALVALLALLAAGMTGRAAHAAQMGWSIDEVIGNPLAPITIIEYASLDCPHCAAFNAEAFPKLKKEWLDTGKAQLIYRDYPLHPGGMAAALLAHCSGNRYFDFVDAFYRTQQQWAAASSPLEALKGIAQLGGMSNDTIEQCLKNADLFHQIQARQQEATDQYGVDSTPTLLINGKLYQGQPEYDDLAKVLNKISK